VATSKALTVKEIIVMVMTNVEQFKNLEGAGYIAQW
jgi:hypothetical protein